MDATYRERATCRAIWRECSTFSTREIERDLHPWAMVSLWFRREDRSLPFSSPHEIWKELSLYPYSCVSMYIIHKCVFIHLLTSGTNSIHASLVGREGAKTPSPFLERALHSSEGRDSYPFLSCSNGEETVSSSLPRTTCAPSFLFRAEEIMSLF